VYDDNGRLHAVISPTGEAAVYEYDAAGNITAIRRLAADSLAIISFSPHEGLPGDQVTFTGVGFGGGVTGVSFNGASATIVSVTPSRVVATVPPAATTGLVTITTPTGSVSTTTPFTIAGLRITPSFAAVYFGGNVQFSAEVLPATLDQSVQWSVEDINGGNAAVGTISASGLYTAPNTRFSSLRIRATSIADSARFAEAQVKVSDPNDVQSIFAAAVSVQRQDRVSVASLAGPVTVRYNIPSELQAAVAPLVSVQYGDSGELMAVVSAALSVQHAGQTQAAGLTQPVSVQYANGVGQYSAQAAVSSTAGPYIQSLSPSSLSRNTSTTITLNGVGLTNASALRFITANGLNDSAITFSNIVVSGDGTSLTATITVGSGADLSSHTVVVVTPAGDSITVNLGTNALNIVP
jgi:YD repeat-containing protein